MRTRDKQFKHTLLSNSPHIIYDGLSSRMFGITNVQPSSGLAEEVFLANSTLITDQSRYSDKVYLLGVQREPLEFSMRLFFDPHTFDERKFQEMKEWFRQDTYKPFRYDSGKEQDLDIWVYAIVTGESKAYHNAIDDGFIDFTFQTNAPHRFSQIMEDEFDFTVTNTEKMVTDVKDGFYQTIEASETLQSRLRQSLIGLDDLTNTYVMEYDEYISPIIEKINDAIPEIDKAYSQLNKVENTSPEYQKRWEEQRDELLTILDKVDVSKGLPLSDLWRRSGTNLYSKALKSENLKLELNGAEPYDSSYVASDFIPVSSGEIYNWHTHETPFIDSPRLVFYDRDKNYIEAKLYDSTKKLTFEIPKDTFFLRVSAPIDKQSDATWKIEKGDTQTEYTENPFDVFPALQTTEILRSVQELSAVIADMDNVELNTTNYMNNVSNRIDNTLDIYPDIVSVYNFGSLPCKPIIEIEVQDPVDIRIENLDTGESTTITDNVNGEVITLLNETEEIETSRTEITGDYYKYDSHDDNFITLGQFENQLRFYGSFKVKITYQFKIL